VTCSVLVVGMPSPAGCASTKTWRAAASLVQQRLDARFGPAVTFEYAELFGPEMARHPDVEAEIVAGEAVPPIVVIAGVRRFAGGKLNVSAIERAVAETIAPTTVPLPATAAPPLRPGKDAPRD
jgi:hypothetical protein